MAPQQTHNGAFNPAQEGANDEAQNQPQVGRDGHVADVVKNELVGWIEGLIGRVIGPQIHAGSHSESRGIQQDVKDQAGDKTADGACFDPLGSAGDAAAPRRQATNQGQNNKDGPGRDQEQECADESCPAGRHDIGAEVERKEGIDCDQDQEQADQQAGHRAALDHGFPPGCAAAGSQTSFTA